MAINVSTLKPASLKSKEVATVDNVENMFDTLTTNMANLIASEEARDGQVVTFYQTSAPSSGMKYGDYWLDTDDATYKVYRYQNANGFNTIPLAWVVNTSATSKAIQNAYKAEKIAATKITTFYQATAPAATSVGDLWVDSDDNFKQYRYSGSAWVAYNYNPVTAINSGTTTIDGGKITTGSITAAQIAANTITANKIASYNLTSDNATIQNGLITNAKIADAAITNAKIGDAQITTAKIGDLSVSTLKIQDEAVIVPRSAEGSGSTTIVYTTGETPMKLLILANSSYGGGSSVSSMVLYVNGVAIDSWSTGNSFYSGKVSFMKIVSAAANTKYTITFTSYYSGDVPRGVSLSMLGAKK